MARRDKKLYDDFDRDNSVLENINKWMSSGISNARTNLLIGGSFIAGLAIGAYVAIKYL